ncbi:aminoglycoside phosphotransferase family protein [Bacillus sp. DX1.1]|uniref:aminoglycoside phosphotransferase family protein n=1 Tax=unclassified Bacillus (in: firmicutes) TaxID=185979 RepID=UPI0025707B05|nr:MULTISPECIES: aminoglycoside phosphotransferase family protein [unclassified Bacillus (in: firmicutes)]MDM5155336.1 aminoglycoside phosphotransferase family protein [Bacillus sp. DX1.1]WJE79653.1 aminoglycoside phosphotransferase family protein [Bacillus sp. DX3.1]
MDIKDILEELTSNKIIPQATIEYKRLTGGTTSSLYLLEEFNQERYVVKLNEPKVLEEEAYFLDFYKDNHFLTSLQYVDPSNRYIVYSFIPGSTSYVSGNKKEILQTLVRQLINKYKIVPQVDQWGWRDHLVESWRSFLLDRVLTANQVLNSYLEKGAFDLVFELVHSPNRNPCDKEPYLLHGDCGIHNFIFKENQLNGVIDPTPVLGDPIYDLIYAFCSTPDDLTTETLNNAVSQFAFSENKRGKPLYEEVLILLYLRIETCIRHHPGDLEDYLKAWSYWVETVQLD